MRTAILKLGDSEATFDGDTFTSNDEGAAAILNSALQVYRSVGPSAFNDDLEYNADPFKALVRAVAEYCGGVLVSAEPPESEHVEGRIY